MHDIAKALVASIKTLTCLFGKKIREADIRLQEKQQAEQKRLRTQQANQIKTDLNPKIKIILKNNIYFQDVGTIAISKCEYNEQTAYWDITIETLLKTTHNLEHPRVITTLNDSKDVYFRELQLEQQNDWVELAKAENSPTAELNQINLMRYQIDQRYQLLNHSLDFVSVKCTESGGYTNAQIFVRFR